MSNGSPNDGNIAIKCNYCDGGKDDSHIGFSGVCSDRIIRNNIEVEHRIWCSNESCPCFQYYKRNITRNELNSILNSSRELVCYESTMLSDWEAQAGLTEDGQTTKRFGSTLHRGAACVFTTRLPDMTESKRFVFGIFLIDELFNGDDNESGYVKCNTDYHIELLPDEAKQIKFWNYYRNKNHPEKELWGTGLFRYLSNNAVIGILTDLINLRQGKQKDEVIRFLSEFCRLNYLKIPQNIEKNTPLSKDSLELPQGVETKRFEGIQKKIRNEEPKSVIDYKKMFPVGCSILHKTYGIGVVKTNDSIRLTVLFEGDVEKTLGVEFCVDKGLIDKI